MYYPCDAIVIAGLSKYLFHIFCYNHMFNNRESAALPCNLKCKIEPHKAGHAQSGFMKIYNVKSVFLD